MYVAPSVYYVNDTPSIRSVDITLDEGVAIATTSSPMVEDVVVCASIYDYGCSCQLGLVKLGYPITGLDSEDLQVISLSPQQNGLVLFYYPKNNLYHTAVVSMMFPSGNFEVYECNYRPSVCGNRIVFKDDTHIRGYLNNPNFNRINVPSSL